MTITRNFKQEFQKLGRVWFRNALSAGELTKFRKLSATPGQPGGRFHGTAPLFTAIRQRSFATKIAEIRPEMAPVRIVAFDKTETSTWQLPWHQDRVIAVKDKHEVNGFSRWSQKNGIWHCEPPEDVLRGMLFVRIHLDENSHENGAMEIALGSYRQGKISRSAIAENVGRRANRSDNSAARRCFGDVDVHAASVPASGQAEQSKGSARRLCSGTTAETA